MCPTVCLELNLCVVCSDDLLFALFSVEFFFYFFYLTDLNYAL